MPLGMLKNSIALLYKKKGKDALSRKDLELMITMDFRWFNPKEASALVDLAISSGLIIQEKNKLKANFNWAEHSVPIGFRPDSEVFEEAVHRSCFSAIVDHIDSQIKIKRTDIVAEINEKQETLNIAIEVAALLVGAKHGIDLSGFYELVDKELLDRFGQKSA